MSGSDEQGGFLPPDSCTGELYIELAAGNFNAFDQHAALLTLRTKRQATVEHDVCTADKAEAMLLSGILLSAGLDAGNELLAVICEIVYSTFAVIASALHRITVGAMVPRLTRVEMDHMLGREYLAAMAELRGMEARSPAVTLVVDHTSERATAKHQWGTFGAIFIDIAVFRAILMGA